MRAYLLLIFFCSIFSVNLVFAQCNANVSSCTAGTSPPYTFAGTAATDGPTISYADPQGCSTGEFTLNDEYAYITLYITTSGNLNLLIDGDATTGFLDVVIYNIPSGQSPCTAAMNSANEIACNYASASSGCVQIGNSFPCTSDIPTVPVTAGQVLMVIVNNYSGTSNNFTMQMSSTPGSAGSGPPNASINNLALAGLPPNTICSANAPVQLTAVNNGGTWSGPGVSPAGLFNPVTAGVGTHTITYAIGINPCNASATKTITVLQSPTVTVNSATICAGQTQAALITTVNPTGGTFSWNNGGTLSSTTSPTVTASPTVTTIYTTTYTAANGCARTATSQVLVNAAPTLTVNSNNQVCQGSTITFTSNSSGAVNYLWTGPSAFSQTTTTGSLSIPNADPSMSGTYSILATSAAGCTVSTTSSVNVIATSTVAVTPTISVCEGTDVFLTANTPAMVANSYNWTGPGGYVSSVQNPTLTATIPSQSGVYTVTANFTSASFTCSSTNTTTVTINALPTVTLSVNNSVCQTNAINFVSTPGIASYTWTGPAGFNQTTTTNTISITNADPTMSGTYTVFAQTTAGCSGSASSTVDVIATSSVAVTPTIAVCQGTDVFLLANTPSMAANGYNWAGPSGFATSVQNPTITNTNPTHSGVYTVTASFTNSTFTCTSSNTTTVTVFAMPTLTLASNSMVCQASAINLTATSGIASYTWTGPAAFNQITTTNTITIPNANQSMSGTYSVVAQTSDGCSSSTTTTVGVIATQSVTTLSNIMSCEGSTVGLTASTGTVTASNFVWNGPNGYTSTLQNPVITNALPSQTGIYTVTANFIAGTYTCSRVNTTSVTVIGSTPVALTPISSICNNGTINLTAPSGGNSYAWSGPNSFTSAVQNPTITNANLNHEGVYTVSVTITGCVSQGTINIDVYAPLGIISVPTNTILCFGKTAILNAGGGTGGSGLYTYSWSPTANLSSTNSPVTTVTANTTTNYTLTVGDANCAITTKTTAVVNVSVNPLPAITFSTSNNRGCEPFCTDLISNSVPASVNCLWEFSGGSSVSGCNITNYCFTDPSVYSTSLTVTDINGCVNSVNSNTFITVDPKPRANFVFTPDNPTIFENMISFYDDSEEGLPMTDWKWSFGDYYVSPTNDSAFVANPFHTYDNVGSYVVTLQVTNSFGCVNNTERVVVIEDEFAMFIPNSFTPFKNDGKNDEWCVQGRGFLPETFEVTIYDRWGSVMYKSNDINKCWDGSIKGGPLAKEGVYVYKITLKDHKRHVKELLGHITLL